MKIYYRIVFIVSAFLIVYTFCVPVLISLDSDVAVICGFGLAVVAFPLFILWAIKIFKSIKK